MDHVILGAGLSGLSAAAGLINAGHRVTIIERTANVGGLARSFKEGEYIFDIGPHIFFGAKMSGRLKALLGDSIDIRPNYNLKEAIFFNGRVFHYPFRPKDLAINMRKSKLLKVMWELLVRGLNGSNRRSDAVDLYDWATSKVGPTLFNYTGLGGYVEKLYGVPADQVSADWGKQRLKPLLGFSLWGALRRGLLTTPQQKPQTFYCPSGIGEIGEALSSYCLNHGGSLCLNSQVEAIEIRDNKVAEITLREGSRIRNLRGDHFVSTMGIVDLIRMLRPAPPSEVLAAVDALRYRNLVVLYLTIDKASVLKHCLVYVAERNVTFKRLSEFKYFTDRAAPVDKTSLCVETTCDPKEDLWTQPDEAIFDRIVPELGALGIVAPNAVTGYRVRRVVHAYPVYFIGYEKALGKILDFLGGIENLVSIGRQGLYQHDNMSKVIREGFALAEGLNDACADGPGDVGGDVRGDVYRKRLDKYAHVD